MLQEINKQVTPQVLGLCVFPKFPQSNRETQRETPS